LEKDEDGPLGWLRPVLESAYSLLEPRGVAHAPIAGAARALKSSLQLEGNATLASVAQTDWRALLGEYKRRKAAAALVPAPAVPGGQNWLPLGPTMVLDGQALGDPPVGGRVCGLAIAPGGQILYAASANGGVFRSETGGTSWRALMDEFDLDPTNFASASLVCGAVAIDPADPDRVYVGTGEGDTHEMFRKGLQIQFALPAYRGVGPLRTDDGGDSWHPEPSSPDLAGEAFFALAVDPQNRENVVGATSAGLYQRVPKAGGFEWVQRRANVHCSVTVASAGATTRFFAAEWGVGVFHSTNGENWTATGTGFPASNVGRITLGRQANNPNLLYAFIARPDGAVGGVYRLDGEGGAWKKVGNIPAEILAGSQGDYDLAIAVDPADADWIYLGGDRVDDFPNGAAIYRCQVQPAGTGFTAVNPTSIGEHAHADVHVLVHTPGDPTELWCGCDGGVFLNRNPRDGGQFASQNNGLACLCTNFIAQHPNNPDVLFCGLQDNGTARTQGGGVWRHVNYGDGGYCVIHWDNPEKVLSYLNGRVYRSTTGGKTHDSWSQIWNMGQFTMTQPIVSAPFNAASAADADWVAVGAGRRVFISKNFGTTWPAGMRPALPPGEGNVFALAFASASRLFIGTTKGEVFRADREGNTWSLTQLHDVTAGPLGLTGLISDVAVDWADVTLASVYVSFGGKGDPRRVWHFDGTRWESRSGPVANVSLLDVEHNALVVDPQAPANVYVGADLGVWHSGNSGATWRPLQNGLPDAPVYDLQIHQTQRLLRAATHGRGLFEIALA